MKDKFYFLLYCNVIVDPKVSNLIKFLSWILLSLMMLYAFVKGAMFHYNGYSNVVVIKVIGFYLFIAVVMFSISKWWFGKK